jgi:hypothetical protein
MGQRPSAFFLPFCNAAEVMIIDKMIKENLVGFLIPFTNVD